MPLAINRLKSLHGIVENCLNQVLGFNWKMEDDLRQQWKTIVGVEFSENVKIQSFKEGVLVLVCFHPAWLMDLRFQKKAIELKINKSNLGFQVRRITVESSW